MIANYTEQGWEIVTQRAHGLLAAEIAAHWRYNIRSERWVETLLAVAEHDDAQVELERDNILTAQGGPVDFKMKVFEKRHCTQTMDFALSKSRYIALLCSMHLEFVYEKDCLDNPEAAKFLARQKTLRKEWRKGLKITLADAKRDYRLLEWCDALSLLICQNESQPQARSVEISNGPDNEVYRLSQIRSDTLTVVPWPFEERHFYLSFETRLIPQLSFKSPDQFRDEFRKAEVKEKRWALEKNGAP